MTLDYTYLRALPAQDLLDCARAHNDDGLIRALAERLEDYLNAYDTVNALERDLADAERRAESWRAEATAVQRQLDMVRG